ncbi:MAG: N-acyl-D-amino-acid deacylase family protein, partial [Thermomicrobiales bacterium]
MSNSDFDLVIRGGRVVDGSGNPWHYGDVALQGQRIAALTTPGRIPNAHARKVIDAGGMVVCPGFIDIQSHSILPLMVDGRCLSKIMQGVTTEIMGELWTPAPFGGRIADPFDNTLAGALGVEAPTEWRLQGREWHRFRDWLETVAEHGTTPNIGSFLAGGTLRRYARGMEMGPATADELAVMRRVVAEAMADGAFGVSYALIYPPESFVETDEIVEVCTEVARYGGIYITHMRSEDARVLEAVEETLTIGRRAGLPVEIYHLKVTRPANWPKMGQVIARINAARAAGIDVAANMYPYTASGTGLSAMLPYWASADGALFDNLRDPMTRARIHDEMARVAGGEEGTLLARNPADIMPIGFKLPAHQEYVGQRLAAIAAVRKQDWIDTILDLLVAEEQSIATIYFQMHEGNVARQLQKPWVKVSTDAGGFDPAWARANGPVHPRSYGTYPRVLGKYVRDEGVLSLEDAIRKMTSAVADRLGLRDRGRLAVGAYADVVIFDPATITDHATFDEPHQLSTGIRDVWVNGARAVAAGAHTGALPGMVVS